jgi:phosphoesterase RecJ-like protein
LLGETLMSLKTEYGGLLAHVTITKEMLRRTSTMEEDTENFTTYPMSVEGVTVGLLFLEIDNGVKVSFRSKGEIAINRLAQMFGGNGHTNAAGARIEGGKIDEVRRKIIAAAQEFVTTRRT